MPTLASKGKGVRMTHKSMRDNRRLKGLTIAQLAKDTGIAQWKLKALETVKRKNRLSFRSITKHEREALRLALVFHAENGIKLTYRSMEDIVDAEWQRRKDRFIAEYTVITARLLSEAYDRILTEGKV